MRPDRKLPSSKSAISHLWVTVLFFMVLGYQNCGQTTKFSEAPGPAHLSDSNIDSAGSGQPYDGKPYVVRGRGCSDGSPIDSRILLRSRSQAILVKENCQVIEPKILSAGSFTISGENRDELQYENKVYVSEEPKIKVAQQTTWYMQLSGTPAASTASVYVIDMFDTSAAEIESLKSSGHTVFCNFSAGTAEDWRPDAGEFVASDLGLRVQGASGEKWLDTRSAHVRSTILKRLDLAKAKGCDGVDLDSVDAYDNSTGLALNSTTQIEYNRYLALAAHDREMLVSLKNAGSIASQLVDYFDLAIAEECFAYNECDAFKPFSDHGKAVLAAEFTSFSSNTCAQASALLISLAYFNSSFSGSRYEKCGVSN